MKSRPSLLDRLSEAMVLGDGGYLLELERRGYVQAGPFTPEVAVEHPEALRQLHREFLRAGAEVLEALTFYGTAEKLAAVGQQHRREAINRSAVRIAKEIAGDDALVAGVVTFTTLWDVGADRERVRATFREHAALLVDEGVDFFIGETFQYLEEALIALSVLREMGRPVMITLNAGEHGTLDGVSPAECARRLAGEGADVVGVNCSYDPRASLRVAARMREATNAYVACQPLGFRTEDPTVPFTRLSEFPLALEGRQLTRFDLADFARDAQRLGVNFVGGCCGVVAHHVRAMAEALGRRPLASAKSPDLSRHVIDDVRRKSIDSFRSERSTEAGTER